VGLLPSTLGRLYTSAYYAVRDTRTPLRYALLRVTVGTALGYALAIQLPPAAGWPPLWGAAGITLGSGIGSWVEMWLLRRTLCGRLGQIGLPASLLVRLWGTAIAASGAAWAVKAVLPLTHPVVAGVIILGAFGLAYLGGTMAFGVPEGRLLGSRPAGSRPRGG
jgi:putative peptidoglycan lipid II flippase